MAVSTSFHLYSEQIKFIEDKKWEFRISRSKIMRNLINYYMKNPDKFEEIIKGDKNDRNKND